LGYTHYWTLKGCAPADDWHAAITDIRKLLKTKGKLVQFESDTAAPPTVDALEVRFNGVGNMGHETFSIRSDGETGTHRPGWAFCKTARKPYDLVVTACLLVLKAKMPLWIELDSDGGWAHESADFRGGWQSAEALCRKVLNYQDGDFAAAKADLRP